MPGRKKKGGGGSGGAPREIPEIRRDRGMIHDPRFLPIKDRYPPRPGQEEVAHPLATNSNNNNDMWANDNSPGLVKQPTDPQIGGGGYGYDTKTYGWENAYANNDDNYGRDADSGDEFECNCCRDVKCGHLGNVIAFLGVLGILLAYMYCNIEIFTAIGTTKNWLNCLAYAFLGLPVLTAITCVLCGLVAASQGDDDLLCFPSTFDEQAAHVPIIGIVGFIFFFSVGIPMAMFAGQERAIQHYLEPSMSQDVDCYLRPQKKYEHGKVHFVFLNEREWQWNCSSTGYLEGPDGHNYTVDKAPKKARMGTEESHYFYVSNLFYTGGAQWNCPYPIFAACYSTSSSKTCEDLQSDQNCWKGPPVGISLRVMNQNEQFFKNWMNENDKDAEAFIREKIDRKMYAEPWRNHGPLVTYGGDHPLDFEEKLKSIRSAKRALNICTFVIWITLFVIWCCDPEMELILALIVIITCGC